MASAHPSHLHQGALAMSCLVMPWFSLLFNVPIPPRFRCALMYYRNHPRLPLLVAVMSDAPLWVSEEEALFKHLSIFENQQRENRAVGNAVCLLIQFIFLCVPAIEPSIRTNQRTISTFSLSVEHIHSIAVCV